MSDLIYISPEAPALTAKVKQLATVQYGASSEHMANTFNRVSAEAGGAFNGASIDWSNADQATRQAVQEAAAVLENGMRKAQGEQHGLDGSFASKLM